MRKLSVVAIFALCSTLFWSIQAQEITARIHGTVTDASGGGVPGADVKATNTLTGVASNVTTEPDGSFAFLALPVGTYDVTVTKTGFRTFTSRGIHLLLNQDYALPVQLEVGQVTESVQVEANPVQVETTNTQISTVIPSQAIVDMPLNGRNWTTLQQLTPGVVATSDRMGTYASNGSQSQQNSFLVNGADAIDLPLNTVSTQPSPDAIAEFNMITNTINPEYGRNSGAILNAVIKSGTNAFHGDAFEFYRDTFLNARNVIQTVRPVFHQNQFGGTLGGRIIKDHTFFFLSYQGTRARQPQAGNTTTVFSNAQRQGIFPDIATAMATSPIPLVGENGTTYPAGTPYSTIFPTGHIPTADFNPISSKLLSTYVPAANAPGNIFSFNPITTVTQDQGIARLDHVMAHDAFWVYLFLENAPTSQTLPFTGSSLPGFPEIDARHRKSIQADWTHTFSATTLNELRASWLRFNFVSVGVQQVAQPSSFGFTGINPQFSQFASAPLITLTGYFSLGFSNNGPQPRIDSTYELADNLSKVVGSHQLKFGYDGKRYDVWNPFLADNNGAFSFGGTGQYSTGDPGADFLLGVPDSYLQESGGAIYARTFEHYFFAQDSWKVKPNFTFNYGVGYQIDTPVVNSNFGGLDLNCFIPGEQSKVFPTAPVGLAFPGDPGCSSSGYHHHWDHFGPRAGFAYSPDFGKITGGAGKTSIRGGFGVYFNRIEEELTLQNLGSAPFSQLSTGAGDIGGSPSFANPYKDIATGKSVPNRFPFVAPQKGSAVDFSQFEPLSINVVSPNLTAPYAMNYNINIQRELPGSMIAQIGYFGSQGRHLEVTYEGNPITPAGQAACAADPKCIADRNNQSVDYPTHTLYAPGDIFASVGTQATVGDSHYNSLQASLQKRLSRGLFFQLSYTYSHSIDDTSGYENSAGYGPSGSYIGFSPNPYNLEGFYGDSTFDARHRFVASYDWELPAMIHNNGIMHTLVDGWTVTGITVLQTGFPIPIYDSSNRSLLCNGGNWSYYGCPDTPQYIGSGGVTTFDPRVGVASKTASTPTGGPKNLYYFNPNLFTHPAYGTLGNEGRNNLHGPGINDTDLSLFKRFHYGGEQRWIELRLEAFNVFNHTQFGVGSFAATAPATPPNGNVNSANFGRVLGAAPGRIIQLGAKIYF
ncbi:MAG TPA: carboxypeptidase-like regulatory domain-containing protein [Bryobacteraceae bacterium]|nr:carboxypeptidase-like regulatory domain-containing protein [Bryobacteraceae bacterium]